MFDHSTLALFMGATLVFLLTPGPAVFYIVARSIDQGRTAGLISTLGLNTGSLAHVAAAALGVSTLLMSSATAFDIVKYLGAGYLVYLGVRKLLVREEEQTLQARPPEKLSRIFSQGVLVSLLNPKTSLFFFAFLPQFVDPARGGATAQILFLGGIFVMMAFLSDSFYAMLAGTLGQWLKGNLRFLRLQRYFIGSAYIALGLGAALAGSNKGK
jgi:threonine/homoserine/homoserine lactone efflux protein